MPSRLEVWWFPRFSVQMFAVQDFLPGLPLHNRISRCCKDNNTDYTAPLILPDVNSHLPLNNPMISAPLRHWRPWFLEAFQFKSRCDAGELSAIIADARIVSILTWGCLHISIIYSPFYLCTSNCKLFLHCPHYQMSLFMLHAGGYAHVFIVNRHHTTHFSPAPCHRVGCWQKAGQLWIL